eukprot:CAMPEP_0172074418 /NCGR_PEP_ID=MMETSP1043-20130122/15399_1 /TAXON_ID=464988 /ORGANISM="Hemiselmis andersenii, Strain CCMP441" /LENGTH=87 /DNA_ID=CAMNT_0012735073 /DNA_START=306 /DNA_END=565 /DNA_ORIENTATION=-
MIALSRKGMLLTYFLATSKATLSTLRKQESRTKASTRLSVAATMAHDAAPMLLPHSATDVTAFEGEHVIHHASKVVALIVPKRAQVP